MDPLDSLSQISQLLRKKLADRRINTDVKTGKKSPPERGRVERSKKLSAEEIRSVIKNRIQALEPSEREGQKAALIFVESILAWEFGDSVLEDPKFSELSKEVQISISESTEHWPNFQKMLRTL